MKYILVILAATLLMSTSNEKKEPPATPKYLVVVDFTNSGLCLCCDTVTILRVVRRAFSAWPNIRITTNRNEPYQWYKQYVIVTNKSQTAGEGGRAQYASMFNFYYNGGEGGEAYVWSGMLGLNVSRIAAVIVHEIGHTLNLRHQAEWSSTCQLINPTRKGTWMGLADSTASWGVGPTNEGCNLIQNDSVYLSAVFR